MFFIFLVYLHACLSVCCKSVFTCCIHSQAQISDATGAILLHEDVFALQVSVSDGRFALRAVDLCVEVAQAAGGRIGQP